MAFYRLQVEIVQHSHEWGLFAWNGSPSSQHSMFSARPEAFFHLKWPLLTMGEDIVGSADPTHALTNYGLWIPLSIYDVVAQDGIYKLEGLEGIKAELQFQIKDEKLKIGILGNGPGHKSLAIVLQPISPAIGSRTKQYKRITRHDVIELKSSKWKSPEVIFIK
jgi:hypothetical protein